MSDDSLLILNRYNQAINHRQPWKNLWNECFYWTFPDKNTENGGGNNGTPSLAGFNIYDSTATRGSEQLANNIIAELMPANGEWFDITPINNQQSQEIDYQAISQFIKSVFMAAQCQLEMHQAMLDLVVAGTAVISMQACDEFPYITITAQPIHNIAIEYNDSGRVDCLFRYTNMTFAAIMAQFPDISLPRQPKEDENIAVIEAILSDNGQLRYVILCPNLGGLPQILMDIPIEINPFIVFRFTKTTGEIYGRSPVMRALPDIKTANKMVELILKNANIAVNGIWMADDDGVLNPAQISLNPGTIIPKAVGSAGLTPLQPAGDFDISQILLQDLRDNINQALMINHFQLPASQNMTATEITERTGQLTRALGASYGRIVSELLLPLLHNIIHILIARSLIPAQIGDGELTTITIHSPLQRRAKMMQAKAGLEILQTAQSMGVDITPYLTPNAVQWVFQAFDIPLHITNQPQI